VTNLSQQENKDGTDQSSDFHFGDFWSDKNPDRGFLENSII
jgi:hypothetical protein